MISSASSLSASVGAPKLVPRSAACVQRRDHLRMGVPQDHRPPGADVIDVAIAVDVEQIGPFAAREENRLAADAAKRPRRAVHAAGHQLSWHGERGVAFGRVACRKGHECIRQTGMNLINRTLPAASLAQ